MVIERLQNQGAQELDVVIARSQGNGNNFYDTSDLGGGYTHNSGLSVAPLNGNVAAVAAAVASTGTLNDYFYVWISEDAGQTWHYYTDGPSLTDTIDYVAIL